MANSLPKDERKSISDYLLSPEKVESGSYPEEEIFEAKVEQKVLGPFWQEDLKDFVNDAGLYDSDTEIRNINTEKWHSLKEHPLFQRRKPALVSEADINSPDNRYFLLKNGRKIGPFTSEELIGKIQSLEILFTDYVSIDEGQSWGKIYEIEGFERRNFKPSNLPQMPDKSMLNSSVSDASDAVSKSKDSDESLVSLAYIGHLNEGKKKFHIEEKKNKKEKVISEKKTQSSITTVLSLFSVVAMIFSAIYFFLLAPEDSQRPTTIESPSKPIKAKPVIKKAKDVTKKALAPKPKKVIKKKTSRPLKVQKKKVISRSDENIKKAEFFKKKKVFKDRQDLREIEVPPEAIFDDNTDPVELDPIRQRISKDIIDPELEAYDEETPIDELEDISRKIAPIDEFDGQEDRFDDYYDDPQYRDPAAGEEYYEDEPYNE